MDGLGPASRKRSARMPREHLLGRTGNGRGPLVIALGGIHGNERAGVAALQRVLAQLEDEGLELAGELVAFAGNLQALTLGQRYLEDDLNRVWTESIIADVAASGSAAELTAERRELRELLEALTRELADAGSRTVIFLDLHSTSAPGAPFVLSADTLQNRKLALALRAPVLLGLEENIEGTLLAWFGAQGHAAIAFEGGRHGDPETAVHHEAALWILLEQTGLLEGQTPSLIAKGQKLLERSSRGLPRCVAVLHRHHIEPDSEFRMEPGYVSFDRVKRGERMARDRSGPIEACLSGCILLPLYQGQGEDGFFLGRPVRRAWLWLSTVLRRARFERLLPLLPGVRRDPDAPGGLIVHRKAAIWRALDLFHLAGFWKHEQDGSTLRLARRDQHPL